jgi:hypothetical protein
VSEAGEKCGVHYERHPTLPDLVAVCARRSGHDGEHSNVLPKTLAGLGSAQPADRAGDAEEGM